MSGCFLYVEYQEDHKLIYDKVVIRCVFSIMLMRTKRFTRLPNLPGGSRVINIKLTKNFATNIESQNSQHTEITAGPLL